MNDDDLKFRLPIRSSVEIPAELYLKAADYGSKLPVPLSVERLVENILIEHLDKKRKAVWPPERETRCDKPN
jgi:hypothetical protein